MGRQRWMGHKEMDIFPGKIRSFIVPFLEIFDEVFHVLNLL